MSDGCLVATEKTPSQLSPWKAWAHTSVSRRTISINDRDEVRDGSRKEGLEEKKGVTV